MQIKFLTFILLYFLIVGGCSNAVGSQTVPGSETNSQDNNPLQGIPISAVDLGDIFTLHREFRSRELDYHDITVWPFWSINKINFRQIMCRLIW